MALPSPDDLQWELRAKQLKATELERLRASAEKWRNGLAALTSAVALATAAGAPFLGAQLANDDVKLALGISMGVALLALTTGAAQGMRAAFGYPTKILNTGPELRAWTETQITSSVNALKCALTCTVIGIAALGVSAAIGYFGSETPPEDTVGVVKLATSREICGTLAFDKGIVTIASADGTVRHYPLAQVAEISYPGDCQ